MRLTSSWILRLLVAVAILLTGCVPQHAAGLPPLSQPPVAPSALGRPLNAADPQAALSLVPPYFVENRGQLDARVGFTFHTSGATAFFSPTGLTMSLTAPATAVEAPDADPPAPATDLHQAELRQVTKRERPGSQETRRRWVVRAAFAGAARAVQPVGLEPTEAIVSYFQGRPEDWHTGLQTYAAVAYPELWPGIDLVYGSERGHLKYHFTLQPGAEPGQIRLVWQGATAVRLLETGGLEVSTPLGGLVDEPPIAYQEIDGQRVDVPAAFTLENDPASGDSVVGFSVGHYDPAYPLVLDPVMIAYAGYIGGSGDDSAFGVAIDASGSAYVVGNTNSSQASFPESVGPDLTFNGGDWDTFVAKVKPDGSGLVYAGYIGGTGSDEGHGIAVDAGGNAYVTGTTTSNQTSFPVTRGPDLTHNGGRIDAFVAKVKPDGSGLVYAGYIGGRGEDFGSGIAVDAGGNAYVTGTTGSDQASFPVTVGPDLTHDSGAYDAFVARVKPDGSGLVYAGYIGGAGNENGNGIAVDAAGSAYVVGSTSSEQASFPVTGGPDLTYNGGQVDAFVARVKPDGSGLVYAGYIGGADTDQALGIAIDASGSAYVVGETGSRQTSFPVTVGPDLTFNGGYDDAFVAKVRPDGSGLVYAGYIGGANSDFGLGIAVDAAGNAYVAGFTDSQTGFPVTVGPDLTRNGAGNHAFVARVKPDGGSLVYAGYIGGAGVDLGVGVAVDAAGTAYVAGQTGSNQSIFPITVGPDLTYNGGGRDAFVAKVVATDLSPMDEALQQTSVTTAYDPADPRAPAGVFTITGRFKNVSTSTLAHLYFQVTKLTGANVVLNADGGPGAVGAVLSVPAAALGSDGRLTPGEEFSQRFEVGLKQRGPFTILVDAYGGMATGSSVSATAGAPAAALLGHALGAFETSGTTPAPTSCAPNVAITSAAIGTPGQLRVTVTAKSSAGQPPNALLALAFGPPSNATIDVQAPNGPRAQARAFTYTPPAATQEVVFLLTRQRDGAAFQVSLEATDDCGRWSTFAGAGQSFR